MSALLYDTILLLLIQIGKAGDKVLLSDNYQVNLTARCQGKEVIFWSSAIPVPFTVKCV